MAALPPPKVAPVAAFCPRHGRLGRRVDRDGRTPRATSSRNSGIRQLRNRISEIISIVQGNDFFQFLVHDLVIRDDRSQNLILKIVVM
jgi:hypothetical protein